MTRFTEHLWSDLAHSYGPARAGAEDRAPTRALARRRPRVLVGSAVGLAALGAAAAFAFAGPAAQPAFAVTRTSDGSVLVTFYAAEPINQVEQKLASMGVHETLLIRMAPGPAAVPGPVDCSVTPGATPSGPALKVLVGDDGTETVTPQNAGNSGPGTVTQDRSYHLVSCSYEQSGFTGNSGAGS